MGMFSPNEYFNSMKKWNRAANEEARNGDGHAGRLAWRSCKTPSFGVLAKVDEFLFVETYSHEALLYEEWQKIHLDVEEVDGVKIYASSMEEVEKRMKNRISPRYNSDNIFIGDFRGFYWGGVCIYDTISGRLSLPITRQIRNTEKFRCRIPSTDGKSISFKLKALIVPFRVAIYEKISNPENVETFEEFLKNSPNLEDKWDTQNRTIGHKIPFRCYAIMAYSQQLSSLEEDPKLNFFGY